MEGGNVRVELDPAAAAVTAVAVVLFVAFGTLFPDHDSIETSPVREMATLDQNYRESIQFLHNINSNLVLFCFVKYILFGPYFYIRR